ncbi:MAG: F0F1 ATP synthase subunit B [Maricaulaceae bacterium]
MPFHGTFSPGDATLWVFVALVAFLILLIRLKVANLLARQLDARAQAIADELAQARKLREDAQELLANCQRRHREAEAEAAAIIEQARQDAERLAENTRATMAEQIARRTEAAERKIRQAEADAQAQVRAAVADTAVAIARDVLQKDLDAVGHAKLLEQSFAQLGERLN